MNGDLLLALIRFVKVMGIGLGILTWVWLVFLFGQSVGFFWAVALGVVFPIAMIAAVREYHV